MKKLILFGVFLMSVQLCSADIFTWGIKAGLNSTKLNFDDFKQDPSNPNGLVISPENAQYGFHFGGLARINVAMVFIQPELTFSSVGSTINITDPANAILNDVTTVKYSKIDLPVIVGMKFGPARFGLGPVATFNLSSKNDAKSVVSDAVDDFTSISNVATFGAQVGVGVDILGKLTADIRYEFGLSKITDGVSIGGTTYNTDQRQNQFLVSIGFLF